MFTTDTNTFTRIGVSVLALGAVLAVSLPTDAALARDLGSRLGSRSFSIPRATKAASRAARRAASVGHLSIDTSRLKGSSSRRSLAKRAAKASRSLAKAKSGGLKGELASRLRGSSSKKSLAKRVMKASKTLTKAKNGGLKGEFASRLRGASLAKASKKWTTPKITSVNKSGLAKAVKESNGTPRHPEVGRHPSHGKAVNAAGSNANALPYDEFRVNGAAAASSPAVKTGAVTTAVRNTLKLSNNKLDTIKELAAIDPSAVSFGRAGNAAIRDILAAESVGPGLAVLPSNIENPWAQGDFNGSSSPLVPPWAGYGEGGSSNFANTALLDTIVNSQVAPGARHGSNPGNWAMDDGIVDNIVSLWEAGASFLGGAKGGAAIAEAGARRTGMGIAFMGGLGAGRAFAELTNSDNVIGRYFRDQHFTNDRGMQPPPSQGGASIRAPETEEEEPTHSTMQVGDIEVTPSEPEDESADEQGDGSTLTIGSIEVTPSEPEDESADEQGDGSESSENNGGSSRDSDTSSSSSGSDDSSSSSESDDSSSSDDLQSAQTETEHAEDETDNGESMPGPECNTMYGEECASTQPLPAAMVDDPFMGRYMKPGQDYEARRRQALITHEWTRQPAPQESDGNAWVTVPGPTRPGFQIKDAVTGCDQRISDCQSNAMTGTGSALNVRALYDQAVNPGGPGAE